MSTLTAEQAIELFPDLRHLLLLKDAGWIFFPIEAPGPDGSVLDGAKIWSQGWRDCIRVKEETDALGIRMRTASGRADDIEIVWERSGTLQEIVFGLISMPAPGERHAPNLVIGRNAPSLAIGHMAPLWTPNS